MPSEDQSPVKSADLWLTSISQVLKCIPVNNINNWADDSWLFFRNPNMILKEKGDFH